MRKGRVQTFRAWEEAGELIDDDRNVEKVQKFVEKRESDRGRVGKLGLLWCASTGV